MHMHKYIFHIFLPGTGTQICPNLSPVFLLEFFMIAPRSSVRQNAKKSLHCKKQNYLETNSEPIGSMYGLFTYI